jgi:hypothetical protein
MSVPDPWPALLLALATFRVVRLVGWDDLTIPARRWLTGVGDADHHRIATFVDEVVEKGGDPWTGATPPLPISERRFYLSRLVRCPWCLSVHTSLVVYVSWLWQPRVTLGIATVAALSAVVGLTARWLDP